MKELRSMSDTQTPHADADVEAGQLVVETHGQADQEHGEWAGELPGERPDERPTEHDAAAPAEAEAADSSAGEGADAPTSDDSATTVSAASDKADRKARVRQLEREGEVAADFLETLLDIADLDGDIDVDVDGDRAAIAIVDSEEGRVPRRLVGPDGKVLDALQELTRLAVQVETGERSRLMLDIAGHRAQRRSALVDLAKHAIAEVKETGTKRALEPMTAFERKVVHDEVAAAGLVSESEGVDPKRHVVILPASA
jgi:spoIIIJ-associated protein